MKDNKNYHLSSEVDTSNARNLQADAGNPKRLMRASSTHERVIDMPTKRGENVLLGFLVNTS